MFYQSGHSNGPEITSQEVTGTEIQPQSEGWRLGAFTQGAVRRPCPPITLRLGIRAAVPGPTSNRLQGTRQRHRNPPLSGEDGSAGVNVWKGGRGSRSGHPKARQINLGHRAGWGCRTGPHRPPGNAKPRPQRGRTVSQRRDKM